MSANNVWDSKSRYYNLMTLMEVNGTNLELDAIPLHPDDVVLDVGCGPGRVAIQAAKRVKKVICLDSSEKMLMECRQNCEAAGVTNVEYVLADWEQVEMGKTIPEVDVAILARFGVPTSYEKLQKTARKCAVSIVWAKGAPGLPQSSGKLFHGCYSQDDMERYPQLRPPRTLSFPEPGSDEGKSREELLTEPLPYGGAAIKERMDALHVECHVTTVEEGWDRLFQTKEEAYDWLIQLSGHPELVDAERFHQNVDSCLTKREDGWYFFLPTASDVVWFQTR